MNYTLLHNGTLIDGNGGEPIENGALLLKENKIHAVGRKDDISLPDDEVTMVDVGGGTILPGMIDAHVHVMFAGFDFMKIMTEPFSYKFLVVMPMVGCHQAAISGGLLPIQDGPALSVTGSKRSAIACVKSCAPEPVGSKFALPAV